MIIGKKALFSLFLGAYLLVNVLQLAHINYLYTSTLLALGTCILLPGMLISLILRIRRISFWENLLLIVGLSLAFLEFGGLLLDIVLPLLGVDNPLAFLNILVGFDVYLLLLFVLAWIRTPALTIKLVPRSRSFIEKASSTLPVLFPILAALGAIVLNNGGSNILTLILLGSIAGYTLLLVIFHTKVAVNHYPYALFFIGLACLFTTSLRSWYISGHDIETEYYVFHLTYTHQLWSMSFFQDAYNACISITILPTILTNLLQIQDIYVYKVVFQLIFAISPIMVFFILLNYTSPVLAFLSAFFFMSFPTFFNDMPMLNRQEIGFLFFGLVLYVMLERRRLHQFSKKLMILPSNWLSVPMRRSLFLVFSLGVIVSHYSTNFVLLILMICVYSFTQILSWSFVKKILNVLLLKSRISLKNTYPNTVFLTLPMVVMLLVMTYTWNTLYTNTSSHAVEVVAEVIGSLFITSNAEVRSGDLAQSLFFSPSHVNPEQQLHDYIDSIRSSEVSGGLNDGGFYPDSITNKYPSYPIMQEQLPPTAFGSFLSALHIPVLNIQALLRTLSAYLMQIFVFVGLFAFFLAKNKKPLDLQYLLLCIGGVFLLALITVLPSISVEYGVLRMFQQLLFVLALPIVVGLSSVQFLAKEKQRILITGMIAIFFFLNLTGFISHLTGDYYPQLTLDNAGLYYDAYYVNKADVSAILWLSENDVNNEPIDADLTGGNQMLTYGDILPGSELFPVVIRKKDLVLINISTDRVASLYGSTEYYNSPKPFLDDNKNMIYSDGQYAVYQ